jgi:hypothetical protein
MKFDKREDPAEVLSGFADWELRSFVRVRRLDTIRNH